MRKVVYHLENQTHGTHTMKTFQYHFTSKSSAQRAMREICTEVMQSGVYHMIHHFPGGKIEKTITVN